MRYPLDSFYGNYGYTTHPPALDCAAPLGTTVKSPVKGTVIQVGTNPNYYGGMYVIIREDGSKSYEHYMGHHSAVSVKYGQRVTEGQAIAKVGQTGQATGPHVHYEIKQRNFGALVDARNVYKSRLDIVAMDNPRKLRLKVAMAKTNLVNRRPSGSVKPKGSVYSFNQKVVEKNGKTWVRTRTDSLLHSKAFFDLSKLDNI